MTVAASSIISRVRTQLIDTGVVHWTNAELLQWLSDGQRTLVGINPNSASKRSTVALVAGTRQSLPADGYVLLDIERNIVGTAPGRVIRQTDLAALEAFNPDWHTSTPAVQVRHYLYNPAMQTDFYVYPPNDGTGKADIIYAVMPVDMVNLTDTLVVQDIYQTALFDYVMARAHQKDSDYAAGAQVAATYFAQFQAVAAATSSTAASEPPPGAT